MNLGIPEEEAQCHFSVKVSLVGNSGVGKTRILEAESVPAYHRISGESSIGVDFRVKQYDVDLTRIRVQFWDCPGAERFRRLTSRFAAGSTVVVFVYDVISLSPSPIVTDAHSFQDIEKWRSDIERLAPVAKILVGNKFDICDENPSAREVSLEQAEEYSSEHGMDFFEISATQGIHVSNLFQALLSRITEAIPTPPEPSLLIRKGIKIGKLLLSDRVYRHALYMMNQSNSNKRNSTEIMDWY